MQTKNICKFITPSLGSNLEVSCFILESDPEVIRMKRLLPSHQVMLVVQGEGSFRCNESSVTFGPGSLVFGFKGEEFAAECSPGCEYMYIRFGGVRGDELLRRFRIHTGNRSFNGFDGLIPMWRESLARASELTIDLASESILLYTFSRLSANAAEHNSLVGKMIEMSEEFFSDPGLSLAVIAENLGYNVKYVSHAFKEKMGVGYAEYLRTLRVKYAIFLFEHGIESVKNVALLSGFTDPLYFSTVFKKEIGVTPTEYRNRLTGRKPSGETL